jgi:hypothetical protein
MEAMMLAGMYRVKRLGLGSTPKIISSVYKILQTPDAWGKLSQIDPECEIDLSEEGTPLEIDETDRRHWWAGEGRPIDKTPYSLMAASFLASREGVSSEPSH